MGSIHRHAAPLAGGRAGVDRRPGRRPIDPTNVRLVGLAIYLGMVVLMVLVAGPASASDGSRTAVVTLSSVPSILFLVVVGGGLVIRTIRRRGRLPDHHLAARSTSPQTPLSH